MYSFLHIPATKITCYAIFVAFFVSACTPQDRKSREFIAEGMKSRKIKRVTDVQLLGTATDFAKKAVEKLNKTALPKIDISKTFDCNTKLYIPDSLKFMYVLDYRLVCQETQTGYEKEKQVFQAYTYNSQNNIELVDNLQKIDDKAIIYTSPFTINGKFIGMWTIVMDKKQLIMNIN
jgi:hypothetical protein